MRANQLRQFIIKNSSDCALLIGNGINRYKNAGCSWEVLLKALTKMHCPKLDIDDLSKEGISNTEFFDLLEITTLRETPVFNPKKSNPKIIKLDFPVNSQSENVLQIVQQYACNSKPVSLKDLSIYEPQLTEIKRLSDSINIDLVYSIASLGENKLTALTRSKYIASICAYMKKWEFQPIHKSVALFANKHNIPILTTNYDILLDNAIDAREINFEHEASSALFPVSLCYTHRETPNPDDFAIWHINGVINHPKSILIGLSHYMRGIECIRKLLLLPNYLNTEMVQSPDVKALKNTWIKLVISRHLIILGLSLDKDEIILRWLLIERAKLFAMFPDITKKGFYLISETENLEKGKVLFFKSVGIDVVRVHDYDSMYKIISA